MASNKMNHTNLNKWAISLSSALVLAIVAVLFVSGPAQLIILALAIVEAVVLPKLI